ncbi:MAG: MiaB/RimO family radical SAM methylthiotransferase [candidate division WOR-3 bacterium]|nr:MiaB/RimO family radical SAM methylthiotransferase [candidate division WOR-3 bacterium]MCX7836626.1 MiaB/RimO family radical SAM methylthiotransferase [candidate division WOR-3 bacterium]MDW8113326.1 MiaB/RimO family radical SAM methylthiotransferase [candidate division WOR-3 bacterium]
MNKLYIKTLGCKVNYAESDGLANFFKKQGYEIVEDEKKADTILLNTCAVTKEAEKNSFKWLNRYKKKNYQILLTGCLIPLLKEKQFSGNGQIKILSLEEKQKIVEKEEILPSRRRAFLKIVDGCNRFCHYCLVGRIRGEIRSVCEDWVVKECKRLKELGIKEIVLCGINLGLYGKDIGSSLKNLLLRLEKEISDIRFRLSSLEIDTISDELLSLMIKLVKDGILCPHFHLPLQSGSDRILEKMGRRYRIKEYEQIITKIIENLSDANIGCDVMVGYLGEEEKDFLLTYQFLEKAPFGYFHVFPFSKRPLTPIYQEKETISEKEKKVRLKILMDLREKKIEKYCQKFLNQIRKGILIEEDIYLTDNYLNVKVFGNLRDMLYIKIKDFYIKNKNFPILLGEEFKGG